MYVLRSLASIRFLYTWIHSSLEGSKTKVTLHQSFESPKNKLLIGSDNEVPRYLLKGLPIPQHQRTQNQSQY